MNGNTVLAVALTLQQEVDPVEIIESLGNIPNLALLQNILVPLGLFAMIVLLVWLRHRAAQAKALVRTDVQKHLLDKFNSGEELTRFIESDDGRRFLEQLTVERTDPRAAQLWPVRVGIVLAVLAIGLLALSTQDGGLVFPGIMALTLGIGVLIAAWVSHRLVSKWYRATLDDESPEQTGS